MASTLIWPECPLPHAPQWIRYPACAEPPRHGGHHWGTDNRRQAAGGKAGTAARLPHQQKCCGRSARCPAPSFKSCFSSRLPANAVPALALQLFKPFYVGHKNGCAANGHLNGHSGFSPTPMEAVPGTISVRCLQQQEITLMQSSTRSSSVPISRVMLPAIRKPPVVARRVT